MAQPVSLAHHLLAYSGCRPRRARLTDARVRINVLPLGSAPSPDVVSARSPHGGLELGFDGVTENSLDAVGDRDFVVEFLAACSQVMTHLSKLCEELIYWSTPEFGFISSTTA